MKTIFKIIILSIPVIIFLGCDIKPKEIKKEAYLVKIFYRNQESAGIHEVIKGIINHVFVDAGYAGHLIVDKNNKIYFYGPDKEFKKKIKDFTKNPPSSICRDYYKSEEEKIILTQKQPDIRCIEEQSYCFYSCPMKTNSDEFINRFWTTFVRRVPDFYEHPEGIDYVYIEEEYGRILAKENKAEIDCKYKRKMFGDRKLRNSPPFHPLTSYLMEGCPE